MRFSRFPAFRRVTCLAIIVSLISFMACSAEQSGTEPVTLQGRTMGTTWSVKIAQQALPVSDSELGAEIDALLEQINQLMSTYRADSELSRFNQSRSTEWQSVQPETALVVNTSLEISRLTDGAFDVTVGPLVNLWGFGPEKLAGEIPSDAEIQQRKMHTGYDKLQVRLQPSALRKTDPELYLDLSGIAKGYAVDRVAELLESRQLVHYMVEIGGEIRVRGEKEKGRPWRIAVEKPVANERAVYRVLGLETASLATSGDYRIFIEQDGHRYSHTIDPVTGRPVTHHLASVSVIHPSCMYADAMATALTVLGPERGLAVAQAEKLAVYLIERQEQDFVVHMTADFQHYLLP